MNHGNKIYLVMAALGITGCVATRGVDYVSPTSPERGMAVIRNAPLIHDMDSRGALIDSVDGNRLAVRVAALRVSPGVHKFGVQCSFRINPLLWGTDLDPLTAVTRGSILNQQRVTLEARVEAGRVYQADATLTRDRTCKATLLDVTSK